ncbi:MAG: response regulator transcription factor [Pyrinomonadaceae bacterium]
MKTNIKPFKVCNFSSVVNSYTPSHAEHNLLGQKYNLTLSTIYFDRTSHAKERWLESVLEIWHQGVIVFSKQNKILKSTGLSFLLIERYFPDSEKNENNLPIKLANWIKRYQFNEDSDGIEMTHDPLLRERNGNELRIRLIIDSNAKTKTLMLREVVQIHADTLMTLGLTNREAEVLFLISKGKTNPEIGMLLEISTRTVQKHVEHIYIKLGVETRTAAMLRVNELNPSYSSDKVPAAVPETD